MAIELLTPFTKVELEPEIKDKKRKQVGILGGNFNPVHNAHLVVADQVRQQLGLDKVLLMPEYEPPHVDAKGTIAEHHRLKMLELAIEGIEGLEIETIELERKGFPIPTTPCSCSMNGIQTQIITSSLVQIWWIIYQNGTESMNWWRLCNLSGSNDHAIRQGLLIR